MSQSPQKVAIVGSGIAGLSMLYFLTHPEQNNKFDVTLFESHHRIGIDSQSIYFTGDYADGTFTSDFGGLERIDRDDSDKNDQVEKNNKNDKKNDKHNEKSEKNENTEEKNYKNGENHFHLDLEDFEECLNKKHQQIAQPVNPQSNQNSQKNEKREKTEKNFTQKEKNHVRIDMPLRVFSTRYYPHLTRLLDTISIPYRPENYEASFVEFSGSPIFHYKNFLFKNFSFPYIPNFSFKMLQNPLLRDMVRFLVEAPQHLRNGRLARPPGLVSTFDLMGENASQNSNLQKTQPNLTIPSSNTNHPEKFETLLQYLKAERYSDEFIYHFEIPTVASICTCSYESAANYPAFIIVQYQTLRSGGGVRRIESGANVLAAKLSSHTKRSNLRTNAAVLKVERVFIDKQGNELDVHGNYPNNDELLNKQTTISKKIKILDSRGESLLFDHVIFATQANQTSKILGKSLFPEQYQDQWQQLQQQQQYPNTPIQNPILLPTSSSSSSPSSSTTKDDCDLIDTIALSPIITPPTILSTLNSSTPTHQQSSSSPISLAPQASTIPTTWPLLHSALSRIPYESSELLLHGDTAFLPKSKEHWANVNFLLPTLSQIKSMVDTDITMYPVTPSSLSLLNEQSNAIFTTSSTNFSTPTQTPHLSPDSDINNIDEQTSLSLQINSQSFNSNTQHHNQQQSNSNNNNQIITTDSPISLSHQLSEKWLSSISHQPSAQSQAMALNFDTKFVSQDEGMSTIWMNKVQHGINPSHTILQTWNPYTKIIGDNVEIKNLYGRSFFQRPVVTFDSIQACNELWRLNGQDNVWCIGSFSLGGVPLLESGVSSALIVAKKLGAKNVLVQTEADQLTVKNDQNSTTFPILGWVNQASTFNTAFEFVLWIVFCFLSLVGAYSSTSTTESQTPVKAKQD